MPPVRNQRRVASLLCDRLARLVGLGTRTYATRKESVGELNPPVIRWLDKVLMVNSTVSVSSPRADSVGARRDRAALA
eukprot:1187194-Prorocentrum_minimum.AAC.4